MRFSPPPPPSRIHTPLPVALLCASFSPLSRGLNPHFLLSPHLSLSPESCPLSAPLDRLYFLPSLSATLTKALVTPLANPRPCLPPQGLHFRQPYHTPSNGINKSFSFTTEYQPRSRPLFLFFENRGVYSPTPPPKRVSFLPPQHGLFSSLKPKGPTFRSLPPHPPPACLLAFQIFGSLDCFYTLSFSPSAEVLFPPSPNVILGLSAAAMDKYLSLFPLQILSAPHLLFTFTSFFFWCCLRPPPVCFEGGLYPL